MNQSISEPLDITIAANFWAEAIREVLEFWLRELHIDARIRFAPFDQLIQYLLTPMGGVASAGGLCVILLQLERWSRDRNHIDDAELMRNSEDFFKALREAVLRGEGRQYQVVCCPVTPNLPAADLLLSVEARLAQYATDLPYVDVVTSEELQKMYRPEDSASHFDSYAEKLAHNPYSRLCFATLGTMVARRLYSRHARPRKVIVVDCDNTLWSGVCGETGPLNVVVGPGRRALQQFLIRQVEGGRLLCLCSKNEESDVLAVFNRNRGMLLKLEHLTAWKTNWGAKSDSLRSLSIDLGLNLDGFIFIDDDPFECAQVQTLCPEVLTIHLPREESQIETTLLNVWDLDQTVTTAEDQQRTLYYRQNVERSRAREHTTSLEEFLASLELELKFEQIRPETINRACQLTERTNQFNLNGIRRSVSELRAALSDDARMCLLVGARDRFGDYGTVGLMISRLRHQKLQVNTLLLSCRALGRGIETRMMEKLAMAATTMGATEVEFEYQPTPKNAPLRIFLSKMGISDVQGIWTVLLSALCAAFPPHTVDPSAMRTHCAAGPLPSSEGGVAK